MPVHVEGDSLHQHISLILSPVGEMFASLHVLIDPSHHLSNQPWAALVRSSLAEPLLTELDFFGHHFNAWLRLWDLLDVAGAPDMTVPTFLQWLLAVAPDRVVATALGDDTATEDATSTRTVFEETSAVYRAVRTDPHAFVRRLQRVLQDYWEQSFAVEWERRRPALSQRLAAESVRLEHTDPVDWICGLHSRISYDANRGELVFHKAKELRFRLDHLEGINCYPSTFTSPHLMIGFDDTHLTLYIMTPFTPVEDAKMVPLALVNITKALADETRLLIFRSVMKRPQFTQELAAAMRLAEPTVSRHLKILKAAGLVKSRKEGGVVLYSGSMEPIDQLPQAMREFLRS